MYKYASSNIQIAWMLAINDIKSRYTRTLLGPFWMVLSNLVWACSLGIVSASLFNIPFESHILFVLTGLLAWNYIASILVESCTCFITSESIIKNFPIPLHVSLLRFVFRSIIIFLHNFAVVLIALLLFGKLTVLGLIYFIPSVLIFMATSIAVTILFGFANSRFRDFFPFVTSCVNVLPFMTPIFWNPALLNKHSLFATLNPFYHFVSVMRDPLLYGTYSLTSLFAAIGVCLFLNLIAFIVYQKYKTRLIFWI